MSNWVGISVSWVSGFGSVIDAKFNNASFFFISPTNKLCNPEFQIFSKDFTAVLITYMDFYSSEWALQIDTFV